MITGHGHTVATPLVLCGKVLRICCKAGAASSCTYYGIFLFTIRSHSTSFFQFVHKASFRNQRHGQNSLWIGHNVAEAKKCVGNLSRDHPFLSEQWNIQWISFKQKGVNQYFYYTSGTTGLSLIYWGFFEEDWQVGWSYHIYKLLLFKDHFNDFK